MSDVLILYSGGTDSRLLVKKAREDGLKTLCLFVDYGQGHDEKPPDWCRVVRIAGLSIDFSKKYICVAKDYIPNRNMLLISVAGAIAEQEGIGRIWYGANQSDIKNLYPDCCTWWIAIMSYVLPFSVTLEAPLLGMTQEEVIKELDDNAIQQL